MKIADRIFIALEAKYKAQIAQARTNLEIYLQNSSGVAEHPNIVDECDRLIEQIATAQEKLDELSKIKKDR